MKTMPALIAALTLSACATPPPASAPSLDGFYDAVHHWQNKNGKSYARYVDDDVTAIHGVIEATRTRSRQPKEQGQACELDGTARDTACRRP